MSPEYFDALQRPLPTPESRFFAAVCAALSPDAAAELRLEHLRACMAGHRAQFERVVVGSVRRGSIREDRHPSRKTLNRRARKYRGKSGFSPSLADLGLDAPKGTVVAWLGGPATFRVASGPTDDGHYSIEKGGKVWDAPRSSLFPVAGVR